MVEKLQTQISDSVCYPPGSFAIVEKINEIIDFLNGNEGGLDTDIAPLKEQNLWEWGEEEAKLLDSIIDDYEKAAKSFCGYDGKIGLLRAIRDGKYNLPKPAWSEEDEKLFWGFTAYVPNEELERLGVTRDDLLKKLKTLRPLWSEEDIEKNLIAYLRYERKSTPQEIEEKFIPYIKRIKIMEQESVSPMSYGSLQEWSEEDEKMRQDCIDSVEYELLDNGKDDEVETDPRIVWLKFLPERFNLQPKQERSDRDEEILEFVLGLLDNLVWRRDWEISQAECLEWLVKALNPTKKEWSEEDEKIKKAISYAIAQCTHSDNTLIEGVTKEEALAYIDKQYSAKWSEEDENKIKDIIDYLECWNDFDHGSESFEEYRKRMEGNIQFMKSLRPSDEEIKKAYTKGFNDAAFGGKLKEWSEEDRKMIDHLIEALPMWANGRIAMLPSQADEYVERLKSLPERFNLQPKQEWSKEDENVIETLIRALRVNAQFEFEVRKLGLDDFQTLAVLDKYRKLYPKPHWKPSEEQMEALYNVFYTCSVGAESRDILKSLYEQLKKL